MFAVNREGLIVNYRKYSKRDMSAAVNLLRRPIHTLENCSPILAELNEKISGYNRSMIITECLRPRSNISRLALPGCT